MTLDISRLDISLQLKKYEWSSFQNSDNLDQDLVQFSQRHPPHQPHQGNFTKDPEAPEPSIIY